jgi:hypothetical protein
LSPEKKLNFFFSRISTFKEEFLFEKYNFYLSGSIIRLLKENFGSEKKLDFYSSKKLNSYLKVEFIGMPRIL